jgi:Ala-tRNA(Pro) deacylase
VTLFAIFNDPEGRVELIIDRALWEASTFQFHPLVNTSTLVVSRDDLQRFIDKTGHQARLLEIPDQKKEG